MAKDKHQESKGGTTKGKVTVVMFQLEGSDETLKDAIKVLGQGIEKLAPGTPNYRLIQAPTQARTNGAPPVGSETPEVVEPEILEPEEEEDDAAASSQSSEDKPKRKRGF